MLAKLVQTVPTDAEWTMTSKNSKQLAHTVIITPLTPSQYIDSGPTRANLRWYQNNNYTNSNSNKLDVCADNKAAIHQTMNHCARAVCVYFARRQLFGRQSMWVDSVSSIRPFGHVPICAVALLLILPEHIHSASI